METSEHAQWERLRQDVAELEYRWVEAVRKHNEHALRRLLSDHVTAVFFDGSDAQGLDEVIASLFDLGARLRTLEVTESDVHLLSRTVALVSGRALLSTGAPKGAEEARGELLHFTRIWHQRGDHWKIVALHTSRAA